jgi:S-adenosylmethionine-diacylglycerol 3-amino-3-carboxypropyl transferase
MSIPTFAIWRGRRHPTDDLPLLLKSLAKFFFFSVNARINSAMVIFDWVSRRVFNTVHRNNLVYNTCWEDPRLDREALRLGPTDDVLVITSAGCNVLDYALCEPRHVFAVDMNPRQNALLDLKIAALKSLEFEDFFKLFGEGRLPGAQRIYRDKIRGLLGDWSKNFWDRKIKWFDNRRSTFYFRGTSGFFARLMKVYTDKFIKVRPHLNALLNAQSLDEQREIYHGRIRDKFWSGLVKFALNRDTTMSMLGVPKAQRRQIEATYSGDLVKYIQECLEGAFVKLPMKDNYFWRVYMNGAYTRSCCPEYLVPENFQKLRSGLVDRVSTHTNSVQAFLEAHQGTISRFVLLDHMDWLSDHFFPLLESEWQAITDRAAPNSRLIWRSGGFNTDFINQVNVLRNGTSRPITDLLAFETEMSARLHPLDRVHTYGSFYIAQLNA